MTFITQNANIALLFLIVLASAGLVAATLYFQANFSKINDAYDLRLEELSHVTSELETQKKALADISLEAQIKAKREEEIAGKFGAVKTEKETLEQQKLSLDKQLSTSQSLVGELRSENNKLSTDVVRFRSESEQYQNFYAKCTAELRDANYFAKQYKDALAVCKSKGC